MAAKFGVFLDEDHSKFPTLLRYAGYLNFINGSIVAFNCKFYFMYNFRFVYSVDFLPHCH